MNAGLVREGVGADDGFVGRGSEGDELAEGLAGGVELVQMQAGGDAVVVGADVEGGGGLFEGGVTGALTDAVYGALDLACSGGYGRKRVGDSETEIVVGVRGQDD